MDKDIKKQVAEILGSWSQKKLAYETKRATKKGFATVEEYVASRLKPVRTQETSPEVDTSLTKVWKKTHADGSPFFDVVSLVRKGIPTNPTREMMEWFLLDYGARDPDSFSTDIYDGHKVRDCTMGISACFMFFTVNDTPVLPRPKGSIYGDNDWTEWFSELQHCISNDKMFWVLFEMFYVQDERCLNIDELNKRPRKEVELKERLRVINRASINNQMGGEVEKKSYISQIDRLNEYEDEDYITVYRSFSVQKGKPVRKGITRLSDEGGVHMEGKGISYTFSKWHAMRMAFNINTHLIKKYCKVNDGKAEKILRQWVSERHAEYIEMYDGFYRAIGMFKVKKKDVLLCTDFRDEDELIANPEDVILVDYKFLNSFHFLGMMTAKNVIWSTQKRVKKQVINTTEFFDVCYAVWKEWEEKKPGIVGKALAKGHLSASTLQKFYDFQWESYLGELSNDEEMGFTTVTTSDGIVLLFADQLIYPRKKTETLYQPRVFDCETFERKKSAPTQVSLEHLIGKVPEKTWFDPTPEYPSGDVSNLSFLSK